VKTIPIHEAKTHLSRLIQRALDGEEIIIAKRNEPLVRLEVIREKPRARCFCGLKSLVLAMGPSFDEPLGDFADYAPPAPQHAAESPSEYQA
jgi:antitoxin (DNA-binding transcriptional repressor) of toxin-antitoxin stability system